MPIDEAALWALAGSRIGPVTFAEADGLIVGELGGSRVSLSIEGDTVRAETTEAVRWPTGVASASTDVMLERMALSRPDLLVISGDPAGALTTTLWVDAGSCDAFALARAVKNVSFTSASARDLITTMGTAAVEAPQPVVETGSEPARDPSGVPPPPPPAPDPGPGR